MITRYQNIVNHPKVIDQRLAIRSINKIIIKQNVINYQELLELLEFIIEQTRSVIN